MKPDISQVAKRAASKTVGRYVAATLTLGSYTGLTACGALPVVDPYTQPAPSVVYVDPCGTAPNDATYYYCQQSLANRAYDNYGYSGGGLGFGWGSWGWSGKFGAGGKIFIEGDHHHENHAPSRPAPIPHGSAAAGHHGSAPAGPHH